MLHKLLTTIANKIKYRFRNKLAWELALAVTLSIVIAYLTYEPLTNFGYYILDRKFMTEEYTEKAAKDGLEKLQIFIEEKGITSKEIAHVNSWVREEQYISVGFYYNNYEIYNSDYGNPPPVGDSLELYFNQYILSGFMDYIYEAPDSTNYQITFADQVILDTQISSYYYTIYYVWVYYICLFLSFIIFLGLFLFFIHRKIQYINNLAADLEILETGVLDYKVRERGADELYHLAVGINQLRCSIIERDENEKRIKEANKKLITALSHDLRTPLTSLIGYVELLILERYQSKEQLQNYLGHIKTKAYHIKQLSDKLFEYFLVSERGEESYHKELIHTLDLITGLSNDQLFNLESEGFLIETQFDVDSLKHACLLDIEYVQRTLDNILSNIDKYADPIVSIQVISREENGFFILEFHNGIKRDLASHESTGIGMKTCERIMDIHGGSFLCYRDGELFISRMTLPVHLNE